MIETNWKAVVPIFALLSFPLAPPLRVSTRGIDAEFIIDATYIFIVTGVTQDTGTKSTGSETVKLSRCPRTYFLDWYWIFMRLIRWFAVVVGAIKRVATSKGTRQGWKKSMVDEGSAICKRAKAPGASATRITTLNIRRFFRVALHYRFVQDRKLRIRLVNNILRVRNICKDYGFRKNDQFNFTILRLILDFSHIP